MPDALGDALSVGWMKFWVNDFAVHRGRWAMLRQAGDGCGQLLDASSGYTCMSDEAMLFGC